MKRFCAVLMSVFMLALSGMLMACSLKKVEANFVQDEVVVYLSNQDFVMDFGNLLNLKNAEKDEIGYRFSNDTLFEKVDGGFKAKKSGVTTVYATFNKNSLASMKVVVAKPFEAPSNFKMEIQKDENNEDVAVITWDESFGMFETDTSQSDPTFAKAYIVEGQKILHNAENPDVTVGSEDFYQRVVASGDGETPNKLVLTDVGEYRLTFKAEKLGYFDDSEVVTPQTFFFGFMPELTVENGGISWDGETGKLSWSSVVAGDNAKYKVRMNGRELGELTEETEMDLSAYFDAIEPGTTATVSVVVFDATGEKWARESEVLNIEKLATPNATYDFSSTYGGRIQIQTDEKAEKYVLTASTEVTSSKHTFENSDATILTDLPDLAAGIWKLSVVASNTKKVEEKYFYHSNEVVFDRIYKLPKVESATAKENEINGDSINLTVTANAPLVSTRLGIERLGVTGDGFMQGAASAETAFAFGDVGKETVSIKQMPTQQQNEVSGSDAYVLNSAESEELTFVKLAQISDGILHKYENGKSVFSFEAVENATDYELQRWNGESFENVVGETVQPLYTVQIQEDGQVKIELSSRIETALSPVNEQFRLRVVAVAGEEEFVIKSGTEKELQILKTPTSVARDDETQLTYIWGQVAGANEYRLEYYEFVTADGKPDKAAFEACDLSKGLTSKEMTVETCSTNTFEFEHEGYYYVEVFAISNNENVTLSSGGLKEKICVAKQIEFVFDAENFKFGFDESLKEQGLTKATGFFVELSSLDENVTAVEAFAVAGEDDGVSTKCAETVNVQEAESIKLVLTEGFDEEGVVKLKVRAKNADERLYLTGEIVLQVTHLAKVKYADLEIDNRTEQVTIRKTKGVSEIVVSKGDKLLANSTEDATIKIVDDEGNFVKFSLDITLNGSKKEGNYFEIEKTESEDETELNVFLESGKSNIAFQRLSNPTNLQFESGKLVFEHDQATATAYYVVDIDCTGVNGDTNKFTVRFETEKVTVDRHSGEFGVKVDYVEELLEGNKISINIQSFIDKLNEVEDLSSVFAQANSIKFRVFAYQNTERDSEGSTFVQISSLFAKTANEEDFVEVKKFDEVVPTFDYEGQNYTLSWNSAAVGGEPLGAPQLANVQYEIYVRSESGEDTLLESVSTNSFTNFTSEHKTVGQFFTFYVKVSHPQYLTSNASSLVKIYKLRPLDKVTLTDLAELAYVAPEIDFSTAVKVEYGSRVLSENSTSGKVKIEGTENPYDFTIIGQKVEEKEHPEQEEAGKLLCTTYYINSEKASWTAKAMNDEGVKPENDTITFEGNVVSWKEYGVGKNLPSLEYVLIFKDTAGRIATFKTTKTSVNLTDAEDENAQQLLQDLQEFQAGEITVSLSAHLGAYSVVAGDVFYADAQKLLNTVDEGAGECNHYIYNASAVTQKLAMPELSALEYVYEKSDPLNAQHPDVKLSLKGNYGGNGTFEIYRVASTGREYLRKVTASNAGEAYDVTLSSAEIANYLTTENDLKFEIYAVSEGDNAHALLPSSAYVLTLKRAHDLSGVTFKPDQIGFGKVVQFTYSEEFLEELAEGVVLKVDIFSGESSSPTITTSKAFFVTFSGEVDGSEGLFEYDLGTTQSEWFNENLASGGQIKLSAFVNNSAQNSKYFLASVGGTQVNASGMVESEPFEVLASVSDANISRTVNGFEITGGRDGKVAYFVKNGAEIYVVKANGEGRFVFDAPDNWENGQFNLKVMATHETEVISTQTKYYVSSVEKEVLFTMKRLESVDADTIKIERSDDEMRLVWKVVDNAQGYILRTYKVVDGEKGDLVYEYQTDNTNSGGLVKRTLYEIFGETYENLIGENKFSREDLEEDCQVFFELVAVGDGENFNNSHACTFNATIVGNPIRKEDVSVSMGRVYLAGLEEGQKLMYRYVIVDGLETRPIQSWKTTTVVNSTTVLLEIDLKEESAQAFYVEVVIIGEGAASGANFLLDSMPYSSFGDFGFYKVNDILQIQHDPDHPDGITFTLDTLDENNFLYVGRNKQSLDKEEVVSIELTGGITSTSGVGVDFRYSLLDILTALSDSGWSVEMTENMSLTFWAYKQSTPEALYLASKAAKYEFSYISDIQFQEVVKLGTDAKNKGDGDIQEDFVNTYVLFGNDDDEEDMVGGFLTSGFYVKVKQDDFVQTVFVSKEQALSNPYFETTFAVNLVDVFNNEKLEGRSGYFELEFAKVGTKTKFCVSDWLKTDKSGKPFKFFRYANVTSLMIRGGNLTWEGVDAEQYYVYFVASIGGSSPVAWAHIKTKTTTVDTSKMFCDDTSIYVAVQAICEDTSNLSVVSSALTFYSDVSGLPIKVRKNKVQTSVIQIDDGRLFIDWNKDGKFFKLLTEEPSEARSLSMIAEELASEDTIFEEPFTFTLKDLLEENMLFLRLRFTPLAEGGGVQGYARSYDVPIVELVSNLIDFYSRNASGNLKDRIDALVEATTLGSSKATLANFYERIERASAGLGGPALFVDDYLNTLQAGKYKMEYCLLGNAFSLNSYMYEYENSLGKNEIYINGEPDVTITVDQEKSQDYTKALKVTVKKSKVWTYSSSSSAYTQIDATGYYLKVGESYYTLVQSGGWRLQCLSNTALSTTATVTDNGDTLEFYINYNSGDSLLGRFESEIDKVEPKQFQICAIGTDYSLSSKSEMFAMTFLELTQFGIRDGQFYWQTQQNRDTYVIYKQNRATEESTRVSGDLTNPTFSLSGMDGTEASGAGLYEYIRFLLIGGVTGNTIYVDSDMLQIQNVFKLYAPQLQNKLGHLFIKGDEQNRTYLANSYSDTDKYVYNLYNDVSTIGLTYLQVCDEEKYFGFEYETGIVPGLDPETPEAAFKATEFNAKNFYAESLGSTATFKKKTNGSSSAYYIKDLECVDVATGEARTEGVVVKSNVGALPAVMLDKVVQETMQIVGGLLNFDTVVGREIDGSSLKIPESAQDVYKIRVERYTTNEVENVETRVGTEDDIETFYTALEKDGKIVFDFLNVKEKPELDREDVLYKVTVQAVALLSGSNEVPLVEGGFAGGHTKYANSNFESLMSEGAVLSGLKRIKPIDEGSLSVNENGLLSWTYTPAVTSVAGDTLTENNLENYFRFVVADENGREYVGTKTITYADGTFTITFAETPGERTIPEGISTLQVYVVIGSGNPDRQLINSVARSGQFTKLTGILGTDFEVLTMSGNEYISFENYFTRPDSQQNEIVAHFEDLNALNGSAEREIVFTSSKNKLYIMKDSVNTESVSWPDGYVEDYVIITSEDTSKVWFEVRCEGKLNSNRSEAFMLHRTSVENVKIAWDDEEQEFSWDYPFNSFNSVVTAQQMKYVYTANATCPLYENEDDLETPSEKTVESGEVLNVAEDVAEKDHIKIIKDGAFYFVKRTDFKKEIQEDMGEDGAQKTKTFDGSALVKVVENQGENAIVEIEGELFRVSASKIEKPTFVVEATYIIGDAQEVRTYTIKESTFKPTIVATVKLKLRIKLNQTSIQSDELSYVDETDADGNGSTDSVEFNLFAEGQGTSANPYVIKTAQQFANIKHRMSKDLNEYTTAGLQHKDEETRYYFSLEPEGDDGLQLDFSGIYVDGAFDGILLGNGNTVSFTSSGVERLDSTLDVRNTDTAISDGNETKFSFKNATALFREIRQGAQIQNLHIKANFQSSATIQDRTLISAIAISNSGVIEGVEIDEFSTNFVGYVASSTVLTMSYSGVVSVNRGTLKNCKFNAQTEIQDSGRAQNIFFAGLVYTNYATLEDCSTAETASLKMVLSATGASGIQIAGIAISNIGGNIKAENNATISVNATKSNSMTCFAGGVVVLQKGVFDLQTQSTKVPTVSGISTMTVDDGSGYATTKSVG